MKGDTLASDVTTASYLFVSSVLSQSNKPAGYPAEWGSYTQIWGTAIADYEMDPEMTGDAKLRPKIAEGLKQLPILSLVSDKDNFFSHKNDPDRGGIYIFTGPPVGDNTGHGWTRAANVELMGGPQGHDLSVGCGVRLHGGHGRLAEKNPKHSFRLVFKEQYGPKTLKYPLYGEDEPSKFDQLVLRCHFGNAWQHWSEDNRQKAQYTRDVWARRMQRRMGHTSVNALYVHLFLNGMYWGIYNVAERVDDQYGKDHLGGSKSDIDVVKIEEDGGNHIEAAEGTLDAWELMTKTAARAADDAYYQQLDTLLDIGNFIDYMLINQYGGNTDWAHHNWYAIRRRGDESGPSTGFRFLCWDSEIIFVNVNENVLTKNDGNGFPTGIFHNLLKNRQFARRYYQRANEVLADDGPLGQQSVVEVWDSLYNTISTALYAEAARWGDYRRDVHRWQSKGKLYTVAAAQGVLPLPHEERAGQHQQLCAHHRHQHRQQRDGRPQLLQPAGSAGGPAATRHLYCERKESNHQIKKSKDETYMLTPDGIPGCLRLGGGRQCPDRQREGRQLRPLRQWPDSHHRRIEERAHCGQAGGIALCRRRAARQRHPSAAVDIGTETRRRHCNARP